MTVSEVPIGCGGDALWMERALSLARSAIGGTEPNPRVGCVLVGADGQLIGEGCTQEAGGPHAEVMALRDAAARGHATQGATAYVTLEPCSHHGRTGPCCDALLQARIGRLVAAIEDPNPRVAGQGLARLRAGGIAVDVGLQADAARELNIGFFSRMLRGRPWVRMKLAASLDGITALADGRSQWITSPAARADGHAWRARAGVIVTGIGTVLADNPRLDVREAPVRTQPPLAVVDSALQLPADAALLDIPRKLRVYCAERDAQREAALTARGATIVHLPGPGAHGRPKVDLAAMLDDLAREGANELHLEAGTKLNGSLLRAGLVDELLIYLAPSLLGTGQPMAALPPLAGLDDALRLRFHAIGQVGPDLRLLARIDRQPAWP